MTAESASNNYDMKSFDIQAALKSVGKLRVDRETTSDEASGAMKILGNFNKCMVGMASFSGLTPWERHQDDELLQIMEGEVDLTILTEDKACKTTLTKDSIFIVPRGLWHNQSSPQGVKLIFITSQQGNETSEEHPRVST